jgi:hypothetical protein
VLGVDKTYEVVEAGAGEDAAPPTPQGIRCGGSLCTPGSQECCLGAQNTLSCTSTSLSDPCPQGTDIPCDDPSDCSSGVCCMTQDGQGDLLGTVCAAACSGGEIELCAPGGTCTQGKCSSIAVQPDPPLTGFYACQ